MLGSNLEKRQQKSPENRASCVHFGAVEKKRHPRPHDIEIIALFDAEFGSFVAGFCSGVKLCHGPKDCYRHPQEHGIACNRISRLSSIAVHHRKREQVLIVWEQ
jgi:hypothetical protein